MPSRKRNSRPRTSGAGNRLAPVNLHEFEALARERVSPPVWAYISGGAADEVTLRRNRAAYEPILLKPRVLVDVSKLDTRLSLFGQALDFPILLAPAAYHKLIHPEGESATARGAAAANATLVVSSFATVAIEKLAQASDARLWFQLYVQPDRAFCRDLIQRAEAAGCQALVITVDTPVAPTRDRELRAPLKLPRGVTMENLRPLWSAAARRRSSRREIAPASVQPTSSQPYAAVLDPALDWRTLEWLRACAKTPVLLKGILAPQDARRAAESGADGIIVSNHGARNLDTAPASIEALPLVAEAVASRIPILLDGGIRRGTDVMKALALGAQAVLIGRPYLWGLAANGADGVRAVVEMLRRELEVAMALCGVTRLREINREILWHPPSC
ncbi:MAG: alpha-hydroxy acid oxidase [Candidatus Acidiferrales bacterium]